MNKDHILYYLLRNTLITFMIAFISFMISLMNFYQCNIIESIQRIFFIDIYTTLYFLLIWLFNYMVFEISKILYDEYRYLAGYKPIIIFVLMIIIIWLLPIFDIFQYDFIILSLLVISRIIKEMLKKTS